MNDAARNEVKQTGAPIDRVQGLKSLIGNPPLLELHLKYRGEQRSIYPKAEPLDMTGSIKDRMALHIITRTYESGALVPAAGSSR